MTNKPNEVDLARLFQTVASSLASNRESLNQADGGNHDHGDNMVEIFDLITKTMRSQAEAAPAEQLMQASRALSARKSGSAQVYAKGLQNAASQFQGKDFLTPENITTLIDLLMGTRQQGGTAAPGQGGLGDLLKTVLAGGRAAPTKSGTGAGRVGGGAAPAAEPPGSKSIDLGDVLNAGAAYMNAKKRGADDMTAIAEALRAGSSMSGSAHRSQSGALVVNALLKALAAQSSRK